MSDWRDRLIGWFCYGKTGVSSRTIAAHLTGNRMNWLGYHPVDGSDFSRCYELIGAVPEFKERIGEMASSSRDWAKLVEHWGHLTDLHRSGGDVTQAIRQALAEKDEAA